MNRAVAAVLVSVATPLLAPAGYGPPSSIDGCQSIDGRFVVTAAVVVDPKAGTKGGPPKPNLNDGPLQWEFTWKDTKTGESKTFPAQGVQAGNVSAQLFMAPDGETFALYNHVTVWSPGKSERLGASVIKGDAPGPIPEDRRRHEGMSRRVIVYKKDGTVLKELAVADFLRADEWASVGLVFNRVHWVADFGPLSHRSTARPAYALCRVSPDYTVLQVRVVGKAGRLVNVDLTTGTVLPDDWKPSDKSKTPVRPFVGPDKLEPYTPASREGFVPSLDPVRTEGKYAAADAPAPAEAPKVERPAKSVPAAPAYAPLKLIKDGFQKLDTPTWLPAEKCLIACDIEAAKLFKVVGSEASELREGGRGKVGPDGRYYGVLGGKLAAWRPGEDPKVILDKEVSLNDLVVGANGFLYFTTLKDPEKGRVTAVNVAKGSAAVVYDATDLGDLANPNGVALAPDGKFLYVGVSNYKDKKRSGVYRFPVKDDGSVDVAAGKDRKWADVTGPDGIAVAPDGHVYATAGAVVVVLSPEGKRVGEVKIPKGSGTNLCFGGADGKTLFVTTNAALYAAEPK
ncbi:Gluconolactonase OS=Cyclobacteriaceae bacterium AK24 GN=ADIS_1632 PE=4 SV=1: SGL [Gemmataceae bacterium]|nr:Gluconolactonase OS=Cyclobacteriaceae bacterium AK24 GN=ADIS_1632 PE=4 SV=1: SGL [Gemmataceae bacterium]VTU02058.1 Gluconolactonase OS=Cyclobacteriaceae bacterium AK24 GN=ADIS_1632 PE=4 SV=1: SGL [Gemmataceae bacterium]